MIAGTSYRPRDCSPATHLKAVPNSTSSTRTCAQSGRYVTSQRGKCQGQIPPLPYQPSIGRSAYRLGRSLQDALRSASQVALRPHRCDAFVQGTCSLF